MLAVHFVAKGGSKLLKFSQELEVRGVEVVVVVVVVVLPGQARRKGRSTQCSILNRRLTTVTR